eukprot:6926295-Prymnesium_polylepis.1
MCIRDRPIRPPNDTYPDPRAGDERHRREPRSARVPPYGAPSAIGHRVSFMCVGKFDERRTRHCRVAQISAGAGWRAPARKAAGVDLFMLKPEWRRRSGNE